MCLRRICSTGPGCSIGSTRLGALKAGYYADIIAVPGNPLDDIRVLKRVSFVMKGGVVYRR